MHKFILVMAFTIVIPRVWPYIGVDLIISRQRVQGGGTERRTKLGGNRIRTVEGGSVGVA